MARTASWTALESLEARTLLAFITWDGGGGDSDWNNPLNWSGDALPGAADNVLIDSPGHATIHRSADVADTIASLWTLNPLDISAGSLTVNGSWRQSAPLFVSGGSVHSTGNILVNGDVLWIAGAIDGGGNILVYPGRQFSIAGTVTLGKSIYNNGSLRWSAGDIAMSAGTIHNLTDRTFTLASSGMLSGPGWLINSGTILRDGEAGTTTTIALGFSNTSSELELNALPPGVVDAHRGTLSFTGRVVQKNGDSLTGYAVWKVTSSQGTLLLPGPGLTTATATLELDGAGAAFPALESAVSVTDLTLGSGRQFTFPQLGNPAYGHISRLVIDSPGAAISIPSVAADAVEVRGGEVTFRHGLTGHALTIAAGSSAILDGTSSFTDAQIGGAGLLRIRGEFVWLSGTISGPGQLLVAPSGYLHTSGWEYWQTGEHSLTRRTINYGHVDLTSSLFGVGTNGIAISTELVNRGVLEMMVYGYISTTAGVGPGSAPAVISNFGQINVSSAVTLRGAGGGVRLNNFGRVTVLAGSLTLNGGVGGGGTWETADGSELVFGGLGSALDSPTFTGTGRVRQAAVAYWSNPTVYGATQFLNTAPGRLTVFGAGSSFTVGDVRNNGVVRIADGAAVHISGSFYNVGTLDVGAGVLNISRDFNLDPASIVRIRSESPTDPARITVSGNTDLKGALRVSFAWSPQVGATFDFMTFGSRTGQFGTTLFEGVPAPGVPLLIYNPTSARVAIAIV